MSLAAGQEGVYAFEATLASPLWSFGARASRELRQVAVGENGGGGRRLEEKRVRNTKIKSRLGVRLRFPTYREGMRAIVEGDPMPFGSR